MCHRLLRIALSEARLNRWVADLSGALLACGLWCMCLQIGGPQVRMAVVSQVQQRVAILALERRADRRVS